MAGIHSLAKLSHDQATVYRGFSVNAQLQVSNLTEDAFVAKHIVYDHLSSIGGLQNIDSSKTKLLFFS